MDFPDCKTSLGFGHTTLEPTGRGSRINVNQENKQILQKCWISFRFTQLSSYFLRSYSLIYFFYKGLTACFCKKQKRYKAWKEKSLFLQKA